MFNRMFTYYNEDGKLCMASKRRITRTRYNKSRSFTARCNAISRKSPAGNPNWLND
jgi:hypothetical protein